MTNNSNINSDNEINIDQGNEKKGIESKPVNLSETTVNLPEVELTKKSDVEIEQPENPNFKSKGDFLTDQITESTEPTQISVEKKPKEPQPVLIHTIVKTLEKDINEAKSGESKDYFKEADDANKGRNEIINQLKS